jgi:hypothetical protein
MEKIAIPKSFLGLIAFAEDLAEMVCDKMPHLENASESEALLRASIAAALYAEQVYAALLRGSGSSPLAHRFLEEAWYKRDRAQGRLRQHVEKVFAEMFPPQICELLDELEDELIPQ